VRTPFYFDCALPFIVQLRLHLLGIDLCESVEIGYTPLQRSRADHNVVFKDYSAEVQKYFSEDKCFRSK
jgi:hypothetical protein